MNRFLPNANDARWFVVVVASLLGALAAGLLPTGPGMTIVACAAILLFGLPHGSLDIEVLKRQRAAGPAHVAMILLLYVGLAAGMYAMWRIDPVAALAAFLVIAVIHFAEDWDAVRSAFLAQGMAVALLTAPGFLHIADMKSLFVALTGSERAAATAEIMFLLAPVGMAIAVVALVAMWRGGARALAFAGAATLAGMTLLPPAIGFAAFFCLFHSPRHFRVAVADLSALDPRHRRAIVLALTLAALGLAAWLFSSEVRADASDRAVAASFMTLSILTVPHMVVPAILAGLRSRTAPARSSEELSHADQGSPGI